MFTKSSHSITMSDIEFLEHSIEQGLPNDFISHYLKNNGGVPNKTYFYVEKDDGYVEVSFFLPIRFDTTELSNMTIERSYSNLTSKGIPKNYLPFALDWGGNYFSIDLETNNIVLLLMDLGLFTDDAVKYLTRGFNNFIDNLEEGEEEDV